MKNIYALVGTVSTLALASCSSVSNLNENLPISENVATQMSSPWKSEARPSSLGQDRMVRDGWLDSFQVPALSSFVEEVLQNSPDYQATAFRMQAASHNIQVAGADLLPSLGANFNASRTRVSNPDQTGNSLSLGLSARWEADVWGRLTDRKRSAASSYDVARYDYLGARLSLAARVSQAWFDVVEAEAQYDLARRTVVSYEGTVRIVRNRFNRGLSSGLDLRLTLSNLEAARASLSNRKNLRSQSKRSLEILAGRYPSASLKTTSILPDMITSVPAGLPSDLLDRRPDLQAAKARLMVAGYSSDVAKKALLPKFTLTASGSNSTETFSNLLKFDTIFWNMVGGITQPLFEGGKLRYAAKAERARFEAAKQDFASTMLAAFKEVEDALSSDKAFEERVRYTAKAAENAVAAEKVALDQYGQGLIKISVLLESQRQSLAQQSSLLLIKKQRINNRIALHLALGGDFTHSEDTQAWNNKEENSIKIEEEGKRS